jgi:hypothetical protein
MMKAVAMALLGVASATKSGNMVRRYTNSRLAAPRSIPPRHARSPGGNPCSVSCSRLSSFNHPLRGAWSDAAH